MGTEWNLFYSEADGWTVPQAVYGRSQMVFHSFATERRRHEKWLKDTLHIRSHNIALISENINHSAAPFSIWRSQQEFVSIRHFAPFIFVWPDFCVCVVCVFFLLRRPKRQNKWFTFIPIIITERLGTTHKIAKAKLPSGLPREQLHNNKQEKKRIYGSRTHKFL